MSIYCKKCGTENENDAKLCKNCGVNILNETLITGNNVSTKATKLSWSPWLLLIPIIAEFFAQYLFEARGNINGIFALLGVSEFFIVALGGVIFVVGFPFIIALMIYGVKKLRRKPYTNLIKDTLSISLVLFVLGIVGKINSLKDVSHETVSTEKLQNIDFAEIEQLIKSDQCQEAESKLSNIGMNTQEDRKFKYALTECYLEINKPSKALSLLGSPSRNNLPQDFFPSISNSKSTNEGFFEPLQKAKEGTLYSSDEKARICILSSKAYKLKGDQVSENFFAELACQNGDCSLVEK